MNERIRLLAEQAGMALTPRRLYDDNEPDGYLESDLDYLENNLEATRVFFEGGLEKFAELIIRECCNKIERKYKYALGEKTQWAMSQDVQDLLKEHFGVEE
jgi:hypothetical protein